MLHVIFRLISLIYVGMKRKSPASHASGTEKRTRGMNMSLELRENSAVTAITATLQPEKQVIKSRPEDASHGSEVFDLPVSTVLNSTYPI